MYDGFLLTINYHYILAFPGDVCMFLQRKMVYLRLDPEEIFRIGLCVGHLM